MGRVRAGLSGAAIARGVLAALLTYALTLSVLLLSRYRYDADEQAMELYAVNVKAALFASAAGAAAGAWQARAGGIRAPGAGLLTGAITVVVVGLLLNAADGGGTSGAGDALIYLAHPLGAVLGAVLYGRRWLAASSG